MALLSAAERRFARTVSELTYCNPFLPERIEFERDALGRDFVERDADWNVHVESAGRHPNIDALQQRVEFLIAQLRERLARGAQAHSDDLVHYEDLVLYALYYRYHDDFQEAVAQVLNGHGRPGRIAFFAAFVKDFDHFLAIPRVTTPSGYDPAHLFACFFQVRRAFFHIFGNIIGVSAPVVDLRGRVWQSIFTHDMRRYQRVLYEHMGEITCLISGPSGTGKELVARAIGLSRYIPFNARSHAFEDDFAGSFHALNLSALSPTLIESELFGHKRGAFTGALQDHAGWLEICRPRGTVFLDEIGEVDPAIQVKLLRVLQTRLFQRLGDTESRHFHGKIIAATNRNLEVEMRRGRFRADLYYRLCSDMIVAPSLEQRLLDTPEDLQHLVSFIAARLLGEQEAAGLTSEVQQWIERQLDPAYAWPGNVRELEQCVRNIMVRRSYDPSQAGPQTAIEALAGAVCAGTLTAEDLMRHYCSLVYARTGNYQETARRLGLDHRTIKSRIDESLVQQFRGQAVAGRSQHRGEQADPGRQ